MRLLPVLRGLQPLQPPVPAQYSLKPGLYLPEGQSSQVTAESEHLSVMLSGERSPLSAQRHAACKERWASTSFSLES